MKVTMLKILIKDAVNQLDSCGDRISDEERRLRIIKLRELLLKISRAKIEPDNIPVSDSRQCDCGYDPWAMQHE